MDLQIVIENCKNQQRIAQKQLYEFFVGKMLAVARRYSTSNDEALAIVNDGFLKVLTNIRKFEGNPNEIEF